MALTAEDTKDAEEKKNKEMYGGKAGAVLRLPPMPEFCYPNPFLILPFLCVLRVLCGAI
jgi:hypothetical protein